mmetsp:Transcript_54572/g.152247  ORF Transcript_54572/g.152247 Transcript_54572/m.152247 type:complete len:169 (-) Transcript_54572:134-640(-)
MSTEVVVSAGSTLAADCASLSTSLFFRLYPPDAKKVDMSMLPQAKPVEDKQDDSAYARVQLLGPQAAPAAARQPDSGTDAEALKRKLLEALSDPFGGEAASGAAPSGSAATPGAGAADLARLPVKELKQRINAAGGQVPAHVTEKAELVQLLLHLSEEPDAKKARGIA